MDENSTKPRNLTREVGSSGTQIFKGVIVAEEYNQFLIGKRAVRQYEIMRRSDATAYQALMACILPLLDAEWSIEPASEDENDQYIAGFVNYNLFDCHLSWANHVREALNMLAFGFAVSEKTYTTGEYEGKFRIVLDKLGFRKQVSINKWEMEDGKPGVTQQLQGDKKNGKASLVSIPETKLVIYTNEKEGDNYEGISRLRRCYKNWDMKEKYELLHAVGLEKAAIPTPVVKFPAGGVTDQAEKDKAKQSIREYRSNEEGFLMVPVGWDITEFKISTEGIQQLLPAIQYHDRQMLRVAMAQFLEIGSASSSGSFAASDNQNSLYLKALKSVAETIRYTAQQHIVNQLCDLNFSDMPNGYPKLKVSKLNDDDIVKVADAIQKLSGSHLFTPTFETEQNLRAMVGISPLPDEYEEDYEEKREAAREMVNNPPEVVPAADPNADVPPDKKKAAKKADAMRASRAARQGLIDVILG